MPVSLGILWYISSFFQVWGELRDFTCWSPFAPSVCFCWAASPKCSDRDLIVKGMWNLEEYCRMYSGHLRESEAKIHYDTWYILCSVLQIRCIRYFTTCFSMWQSFSHYNVTHHYHNSCQVCRRSGEDFQSWWCCAALSVTPPVTIHRSMHPLEMYGYMQHPVNWS